MPADTLALAVGSESDAESQKTGDGQSGAQWPQLLSGSVALLGLVVLIAGAIGAVVNNFGASSAAPDYETDLPRDAQGTSTKWMLNVPRGWRESKIKEFCFDLAGKAECVWKGNPNVQGVSEVEVLATEPELEQILAKYPLVRKSEPVIITDVLPEVSHMEAEAFVDIPGDEVAEGAPVGVPFDVEQNNNAVAAAADETEATSQPTRSQLPTRSSNVAPPITRSRQPTRSSKVKKPKKHNSIVGWNLDIIDSNKGQTDGMILFPNDGKGVHVYVADTGIFTDHHEFGGRAIPLFESVGGGQRVCLPTDKTCAADTRGHGTHCASVIGGSSLGVAKQANLYGMKIIGDDGTCQSSWVVQAMEFVAAHHKKPAVMSMSLGLSANSGAVDRAIETVIGAGVTVVVAAGNQNQDACTTSPASSQLALTVGSFDKRLRRSAFSNYGQCLNIYAPGEPIEGGFYTGVDATAKMSGTSQACPHVSGVVAMILKEHPTLVPSEVKNVLMQMANKNGVISGDIGGTANYRLHVNRKGTPDVIPTPAPSALASAYDMGHATASNFFKVNSGLCTIPVVAPGCIQSPHFPGKYDNSEKCEIEVLASAKGKALEAWRFETEDFYDSLTINHHKYSGKKTTPEGVELDGTPLVWSTDGQIKAAGWELCLEGTKATIAPTPPPTFYVPRCDSFCSGGKYSWESKCTYKTRSCLGCKKCCESWCATDPLPEKERCQYAHCLGCSYCLTEDILSKYAIGR